MRKLSFVAAVTVFLCLFSTTSIASKAYVTDDFRISLRSGPGLKNRILKFLSSGQSLEVLDEKEGWSQVRHVDPGKPVAEGWVLSRYLITRLPWKEQIKSLKERNYGSEGGMEFLEEEVEEMRLREQVLSSEVRKYAAALERSRAEFAALKEGASDYMSLKKDYGAIQEEAKKLRQEVERLKKSQRNKWFATGALILLCGLIIGMLFGRQERKRHSYY